ncbi:uncharacterized protein LOC114245320 isoform X1 [Bombyx mandarina]|uniref:Uncharacterized protein LOC114245320 isoform X1 n=1 Tax=Bombyx mandarina TaxID=7092 RepID=A0A6J2JUG0_BOMMA|nr:uncharacterized protein LOC114245320 isoform X1 [Bombyx mandarina]
MAVLPILPVLLLAAIARCTCDQNKLHSDGNRFSASHFGELLKPPPPPISRILPVPFHGSGGRIQQQNADVGYNYQPPPQMPSPLPPSNGFKFPAPFYKQYNFNYVPPPQPFTTTPSPSLFQKVSTWLFPSQQTSHDPTSLVFSGNNGNQIKKDCNPCNLVPWLPVIRYNNLGNENTYQKPVSTYGPPSPTAVTNIQNGRQYNSQSFHVQQNVNQNLKTLSSSSFLPQPNFGSPPQSNNIQSSTYGPPSPTHTLELNSQNPLSSSFSISSSTYGLPSSYYGIPNGAPMDQTSNSYSPPSNHIFNTFPNEISSYNHMSSTYAPSTLYGTPAPMYSTTSYSYGIPYPGTTPEAWTPAVQPNDVNNNSPQSDVEILRDLNPSHELQLPKVTHPTEFRNSYGETITNINVLDISYPASATAAESTKVRTEVLPHGVTNMTYPKHSLALANPAPFTLNKGRNIHTLQPVALPNLSVSPLPPIFNARPFRPITAFPSNVVQGINQMQQTLNNYNVAQSIPLVEYTHSVDYPATFVESPVIDINAVQNTNQSKSYRNIPSSYVIDEIKDISPQASEDHISATKTSDASFESTGVDVGNDINYDTGIPLEMNKNSFHNSDNKPSFADLRGVKDEDVDKYRTENNLQNIDSPLLYLKPSAPHKNHGDFILSLSTPRAENEYEIYDDAPSTTIAPKPPTLTSWDESRTDYSHSLSPPAEEPVKSNKPKFVQIIVPYTTLRKEVDNDYSQGTKEWSIISEKEFQPRNIPPHKESVFTTTEQYTTLATTTEDTKQEVLENYDQDQLSPANTFNNFYEVRETPFDIIKLQHTIDDWTEQEYSKEYKNQEKTRSSEKLAKQIPDDFFTTTVPTNYDSETNSYHNYDFYDHESASSIQHIVHSTDKINSTLTYPRKEYNMIERTKTKHTDNKNGSLNEINKFHVYTAASSFRTTPVTSSTSTTTPPPWGKIQTSISPLTKEKVYVVTSRPWRDIGNISNSWYVNEKFETKKTIVDSIQNASDEIPLKSATFVNRPSFGFTSGGKIESGRSDTYEFSKSWFQSINALEVESLPDSPTLLEEGSTGITAIGTPKNI